MALLRCIINDISLLAEKSIALVVDVLDNLRPGSTILNSEWAIVLLIVIRGVESSDVTWIICAAGG